MKRTIIITAVFTLLAAPALFADDAAALFKSKCQACHGAGGTADTPMAKKMGVKPLGSADVQKLTDAQLSTMIVNGKGKMPAFNGKLTADQVKALVALIRSFRK